MATKNNNAAILYMAEEFHTSKNRIMGRHSANEGFLSAYAKYADADVAYSYILNENQHKIFGQQYQQLGGKAAKMIGIPFSHPQELAQVGCLYIADPNLTEHAFTRRSILQANADCLYSMCGITHTISSDGAMQLIRNLLLSPVKPWDALICTSKAVKNAVENIIAINAEYYAEHFHQEAIPLKCQLPVIPLGVHTQQFAIGEQREKLRQQWRLKLNVKVDDIVFLFFGRLSFHAKANPFPMFRALEIAARQTGKKIHLLQVGQFANASIEKSFHEAEQVLCPSVQCHYLDGGDAAIRQEIWYAADVFTSLVDNIQESFGLTPIEAMAAGLPVVVTDWDGYRDTVEHGKQGFLIPTSMPAADGVGIELADRFYRHVDNYDRYIANVANYIGVDIVATAKAYIQLIESSALHFQMGKAGRERVERVYDWKHVMDSYQALWVELADIRQAEKSSRNNKSHNTAPLKNPMAMDPYFIFASYPTQVIGDDYAILSVSNDQSIEALERYLALGILDSGLKEPLHLYREVVNVIRQKNPCLAQDVYLGINSVSKDIVIRTVARLIKMGVLDLVVEKKV